MATRREIDKLKASFVQMAVFCELHNSAPEAGSFSKGKRAGLFEALRVLGEHPERLYPLARRWAECFCPGYRNICQTECTACRHAYRDIVKLDLRVE